MLEVAIRYSRRIDGVSLPCKRITIAILNGIDFCVRIREAGGKFLRCKCKIIFIPEEEIESLFLFIRCEIHALTIIIKNLCVTNHNVILLRTKITILVFFLYLNKPDNIYNIYNIIK